MPTLVQVIESSAIDAVHSLRQLLAPIRGILHMEGDLRGSLAKPECDVQVRLLDGAIGGIDLGRAEIVASLTSTSRFLFNAKFEPIIQNGHVHVQGSVPVTFIQNSVLQEEDLETDKSGAARVPGWLKERGTTDEASEKKVSRDRNEEGWDTQLAESLKGLNWNILDVGEVRVDADIKDGGMMLLTALSPYANWLHGNAEIMLQVCKFILSEWAYLLAFTTNNIIKLHFKVIESNFTWVSDVFHINRSEVQSSSRCSMDLHHSTGHLYIHQYCENLLQILVAPFT